MKRLSPYAAGSTLYVPATAWNFMENILAGRYAFLPSITLCLEDSIREADVADGMGRIAQFLGEAAHAVAPPLIFIRPRNAANLAALLERGGLERIHGYVLPKFTLAALPEWETLLRPLSACWMPTLETAEVFDPRAMRLLAERLAQSPCRERLVALRIGGNDLQQLLGVRRHRRHTLYEGPLAAVLGMLAATFLPRGFALSAPVFEILDDARLLRRELERDVMHGFCGKTAIHPGQMPVIRDAFRVAPEEARAARAILADERAVFRHDNAMCEPATHSRWAGNILERLSIFGEAPPSPAPNTPGGLMGFFDNLKQTLAEGRGKLLTEVSRFRNGTFLEGVIAAAVLISAADGNISSEEKKKLCDYVSVSEDLKCFSTDEVIAAFRKIADTYDFDPAIGRAEALKKVGKLRGKEDQARLLVRVAVIIAMSDGNFDESEKKVVRELCAELNLPSADFDC